MFWMLCRLFLIFGGERCKHCVAGVSRLRALTDLNGSSNHENLIVLQCLPEMSGFAQALAPSSVSSLSSRYCLADAPRGCDPVQSVCHEWRVPASSRQLRNGSSHARCLPSPKDSICASPTRSLNDPSIRRISISSAPTSSSLDTQEGG